MGVVLSIINKKGAKDMAVDKNGKVLPKGITIRTDGTYMGRYSFHGDRHTVYGKTLKEVTKKLDDIKYELQHGMYAKAKNLSLNSWFDTWMADYKKNTVKTGTYENYARHYNYYIRNKLGKKMIGDIRSEHIQRLYNDFAKRNFSTGSIKLVSAMLNGCFKQAEKNGIIQKNPVPNATIPRGKPKKEKVVFTVQQQELFLKYAQCSYLYEFFAVALMTGMRNGELRGLRWDDIDFKKQIIQINHTLIYSEEKGHVLDDPKTKSSKRDIPMIDKSYELLKRLYDKAKKSTIINFKNTGYVFSLDDGGIITRERVTLEINRIVKLMQDNDIEIGHITCHCLRHTFATRCIENGMPPQVLKTILGHSNLSMTMDLYSHVLPNTKQEEMQKIAGLF